jgi:cytochrome c1
MHQTRTFMPPFPGNDKEAEALVAFIQQVRATRESLPGAQSTGVVVAPPPAAPAMTASSQP